MGNEIRHLSSSVAAPLIAAGEFERTVTIWDITTSQMICELDTILDFGGKRLLLSHNGEFCYTAGYKQGVLACYSTGSGELVWTCTGLHRIQRIGLSQDGKQVYCGLDNKCCAVIDTRTGSRESVLKGIRSLHDSHYQPIRIEAGSELVLQDRTGSVITTIERHTFALLSVQFSPTHVCISEASGAVRCFETNTGNEVWQYCPLDGCHITELTYSDKNEMFFGIEWPYEKAGTARLIKLVDATGVVSTVCDVGVKLAHAFVPSADLLVTSDGNVIRIADGHVVGTIGF